MEKLSPIALEEEFKASGIANTEYNRKIFFAALERGYILGMNRPLIQIKSIDSFLPDIEANTSFKEHVCMKNKISEARYEELVKDFIGEQRAITKTYIEPTDVFKHLGNWIRYQIKLFPSQPQQKTSGTGNRL